MKKFTAKDLCCGMKRGWMKNEGLMSDLISRKEAIELLTSRVLSSKGIFGDLGGAVSGVRELIKAMPSAEPERTAKVKSKNYYGTTTNTVGYFTCVGKCGNCDCEVNEHYVYCPICGARLEWK